MLAPLEDVTVVGLSILHGIGEDAKTCLSVRYLRNQNMARAARYGSARSVCEPVSAALRFGRVLGLCTLIMACALAPLKTAAEALPRVVSMNLCTDQLTLLLAEPEQILSLSRLVSDPRSSAMAGQAAGFALNSGGAEEIVAHDPDIVLAGAYSDRATLSMLRALGLRVEQFAITTSLDEIPGQIRAIGALLAQPARAEALAASVEDRLAAFDATPARDITAAFFYPNGYSLGADTLGNDIVTTAGVRNLAQTLGMTGGGRLSLEQLVLAEPDMLIAAPRYAGHSRSEDLAAHPVLSRYAQAGRVIQSDADWVCGTPFTLRAVETVAAATRDLEPLPPAQ